MNLEPIDIQKYKEFFPDGHITKSHKTRIQILEGAIKTFALNGLENATFAEIAKNAGVSRPLVVHYYPQLNEIFIKCADLVTYSLLKILKKEVDKVQSPTEKLTAFIETFVQCRKRFPFHSKFLFRFNFQSTICDSCRAENTEFLKSGVTHIKKLLDYGKQTGEFKCTNSEACARFILAYMNGTSLLINSADVFDGPELELDLLNTCLKVARGEILF